MLKKLIPVSAIILLFLFGLNQTFFSKSSHSIDGMTMNLKARLKAMVKMYADPSLGTIPPNIRALELAYANTLPTDFSQNKFATWQSIGPYNVGGRTRALAIDVLDQNVLLAGAATGGIRRSTNGGISWYTTQMKDAPTANITSLVQDKRKGKERT
jgi:hypothetical protein